MIPILMYHSIQRVSRKEIMRSIHVSPLSFKIQMFLIKLLGYRGCSVTEAIDALKTDTDRDEKLIALTFDDGYRNFVTNALPTLERYGFSATIYIVSDLIGDSNRWDEKTGISKNDLMSADEVKLCITKGIEIGCHSATHPKLTDHKVDLERELLTSKRNLEKTLAITINAFCYPYGIYDDTIKQLLHQCGYSSATTMKRGRASASDNAFELPRIPITWHTLPHLFILKIISAYEDRRRHN